MKIRIRNQSETVAKSNRSKLGTPHTAGSKSFAHSGHELVLKLYLSLFWYITISYFQS